MMMPSCGGTAIETEQPLTFSEFQASLVAAACDGSSTCCLAAGLPADSQRCRDGYPGTFYADDAASFQAGYAHLDSVAARHCLAAMKASLGTCEVPEQDSALAAACDASVLFIGQQPPGAPCLGFASCQAGNYCRAGTCRVIFPKASDLLPARHAALGASCENTCASDECQYDYTDIPPESRVAVANCYTGDGVWCSPSKVCEPLGEVGAVCERSTCEAGLFCDSGICVPKVPEGTACQIASDECLEGFSCGQEGVCRRLWGFRNFCL